MPYLKNECTPEMQRAVQTVEDRSDKCYQDMALLRQPRNVATWALLTAMATELEIFLQKYGTDSARHRAATRDIATSAPRPWPSSSPASRVGDTVT